MTTPIVQSNVQVLDWVEGDASTYTPHPCKVGHAPGPAEQARAKWLPLIKQQMVAKEGGEGRRFHIAGGDPDRWGFIAVCYGRPLTDPEGGLSARGTEVDLDHPTFLVVVNYSRFSGDETRAEPCEEERISYIPWDSIVSVTFERRKRVG